MIRLGKTFGNLMVDVARDEREAARPRPRAVQLGDRSAGRRGRRRARRGRRQREGRDRLAARRRRRRDGARAPATRPAATSGAALEDEARRRGGPGRRPRSCRATSRSPTAAIAALRRSPGERPRDRSRPASSTSRSTASAASTSSTPTRDGYRRAGDALLETGVTAYLPTFITAPEEQLARRARARSRSTRGGPRILGVHLEGPFLSPGRLGTHPPVGPPRPRRRRCSSGCSTRDRSGW